MLKGSGIAISPELDARLKQQFPPGTSEQALVNALMSQGFKRVGSCHTDASIQQASFSKPGTGILPYDIGADVYWKHDDRGRIVWTKGLVQYSGL